VSTAFNTSEGEQASPDGRFLVHRSALLETSKGYYGDLGYNFIDFYKASRQPWELSTEKTDPFPISGNPHYTDKNGVP
jgi:hypothetical protein